MRLDDYRPGDDIRDLGRGGSGGGGFRGGGGGGMGGLIFSLLPLLLGRKLGWGTLILLAIGGYFLLSSGALNLAGPQTGAPAATSANPAGNIACDTEAERFACNVFGSTHAVWEGILTGYRRPTLNFYTDANRSGCGPAQAAMGPFYCPADEGVYLDTSFFADLANRYGAAGDAAQAYVIAHEVGHHVQQLTGVLNKLRADQARLSQAAGNALHVRMELQADCYAGVWVARARNRSGQPVLEPGDMAEALRAAASVGDDVLMRAAGRRPVPDSFTHGTAAQRSAWLRRGMESGDPRQCDTFSARI